MSNNGIKILLAEDDSNLSFVLKAYLEAKGFIVSHYDNGLDALHAFKENQFDILLLDIMMPAMDGFTLAEEIRKLDKKIPLIFLTAKSLQEDVLTGFEKGADDYIAKPFSMEELIMRINAVLRRWAKTPEDNQIQQISIGKYIFDMMRQELFFEDTVQKLTSKEADLLKLLSTNQNTIIDRAEALRLVWGKDTYFNSRSMDVYVAKLRKYLKNDPDIILQNIHGKGFKLLISKNL